MFKSIYNTQAKLEYRYDEPNSKQLSIDASKRNRDERLNKVMDQFSKNDFTRKGGNLMSQKSAPSPYSSSSKYHSNSGNNRYRDEEEDDDDDIVSMMDKLNRK